MKEYGGYMLVRPAEREASRTSSSLQDWFILKNFRRAIITNAVNQTPSSMDDVQNWARLWDAWRVMGCEYAPHVMSQLRSMNAVVYEQESVSEPAS